MMDTRLEPPVAKDMIKGAPDFLYSEFHLTYSMLLNLLRWGPPAAPLFLPSAFVAPCFLSCCSEFRLSFSMLLNLLRWGALLLALPPSAFCIHFPLPCFPCSAWILGGRGVAGWRCGQGPRGAQPACVLPVTALPKRLADAPTHCRSACCGVEGWRARLLRR